MLALCRALAGASASASTGAAPAGGAAPTADPPLKLSLAAVTNDIFTREDGEFLVRHSALDPPERIQAIETGGCPHAAVREDVSANLAALTTLSARWAADLLLIESGGDNL